MTFGNSLTASAFPLSDPQGSSSLATAALWVQQALLGSLATVIAVIAVASIGFLLLTGRIYLRRGATVVVGCFVLFGAPIVAAALGQLSQDQGSHVRIAQPVAPPPLSALPPPSPSAYDPYAGASIQPR